MKLLVHINQRDSIRHGENAPDSTTVFDLDPGLLPVEQRDFFAEFLDLKTGEFAWKVTRPHQSSPVGQGKLTVTVPVTKETVLAGIAAEFAAYTVAAAKLKAEEDAKQEARNAAHRAVIAKAGVTTYPLFLRRGQDGTVEVCSKGNGGRTEVAVPVTHFSIPYDSYYDGDPVTLRAEYAALKARDDAARTAAIQAAIASATPLIEAKEREAAAADVRREAQLDALALEVGSVYARKRAAGFASDTAIMDHLRTKTLASRELIEAGSYDKDESLSGAALTNKQFLALEGVIARCPEAAAALAANKPYHLAYAYDEDGEDDDGDMTYDTRRLFLRGVPFTVGDLTFTADLLVDQP